MKNKEEVFITNNAGETRNLGEEFAKNLEEREIIALFGDLGGGKTTFVQGLALGLGIKRRIISPTFIIVRSYELESKNTHGQSPRTFYHLDLYRTEKIEDVRSLGLDEIMENNNIVVIEWAEKMKDLLPAKRTDILFKYLTESKREIKIIKYGIQN